MSQNTDTIDTRFMSREFMTTFINIYREHTALWKVKSAEYTNRNKKNKGYEALIEYCRPVYPIANKDFVTKKIQNMRGTFRKELKKIEEHRRRGETYEPRLWYFDLLWFTKDQDVNGADVAKENSDEEKTDKVESEDDNLQDESECNAGLHPNMRYVTIRRKLRRRTQTAAKTKRKRQSEQNHELLKICSAVLSQKDALDEFEAVSANVAAKLKRMEPIQQILAEGLINKVLQMGLFKELTRTTDVAEMYTSKSY